MCARIHKTVSVSFDEVKFWIRSVLAIALGRRLGLNLSKKNNEGKQSLPST